MADYNARFFPDDEYNKRRAEVHEVMANRGLDAILVVSPENIYYLSGLHHMGYFACQILILPRDSEPILVTRAMEHATVQDQVPDVIHVGYSDGDKPLPPPTEARENELLMARPSIKEGEAGLEPWSMSFGIPTRDATDGGPEPSAPVKAIVSSIKEAGLDRANLGVEQTGAFLPYSIANGFMSALPDASWSDASGLVDDCRVIQSPLELESTREAARLSDSMMMSAVAAAGPGIQKREIMAAIYDAMFRRGGTYPGFVPLVRSTRTLQHEHGTWDNTRLNNNDLLFLELAGCIRRYHAPMGRLVYIGKDVPKRAYTMQQICYDAQHAAADKIAPGVTAGEVYEGWQSVVRKAELPNYTRHHCGYSVGIGFPPSWSGSGVPVGLRANSDMVLKTGMVFHLMSWMLRTGRGDSFLSDTVVVTERGCETLTSVSRDVINRQ